MVQPQEEEPRYDFHFARYEASDLVKDAVKISVEKHTRYLEAMSIFANYIKRRRERIARAKRFGELLRSSSD